MLAASTSFSQEVVNNCCILGFSLNKPVLDTAALHRIVEKTGNIQTTDRFGAQYRLKEGIEADYYFRFGFDSLNVKHGQYSTVLHDGVIENWQYDGDGTVYLYGIASGSLFAMGEAREVSDFFTSAYLLETGAIRLDSAQYRWNLPLKSDREFWKRNLISQGWGAQYIYSNNPYGKGGWLPIGFGYLVDALVVAGAVTLAVHGDRPQDRIGAPFAFAAFSMLFKVGLNGWVAKGHMNTYNRLVGSGYPIPKTHWTGLQRARFGHYPDDEIPVRRVTPTPTDRDKSEVPLEP